MKARWWIGIAMTGLLLTAGCAPAPVPMLRGGEPAVAINWPLDQRPAADRQDLKELDSRLPVQELQRVLGRQLHDAAVFSRIELRAEGQKLAPSPDAPVETVLDTSLERLSFRRDGSGFSPYFGIGIGYGGFGMWGSDYDYDHYNYNLCARAEVHAVLRNARSGEIYLEDSFSDHSCIYDRPTRLSRDRLLETIGRDALHRVAERLSQAVKALFY